jgi:transmembrane sensor
MPTSRQIEAEAAEWLARRDASDWTSSDAKALESWLAASIAHKVAYVRLEAAWKTALRLKALRSAVPAEAVAGGQLARRTRFLARAPRLGRDSQIEAPVARTYSKRRHPILYVVAASVLLGIGCATFWLLLPQGSAYHTAVGGIEAVPLEDGSKVTLNTDTDLRVSLTTSERRVDLKQGEAFFEVAHDPGRPFVVRAGAKRIVAVGTQFSVRRQGEDVWVVVTEGKVRLESGDPAGAAPITLIRAGNMARAQESGVLVSPENPADAESALSWRQGYVVLHDTPITEAAAEFNRYNVRKIVIADPAVGNIRVGGNFRSTNSEAFVRLLANGLPIHIEENDQEIVLTSR